MQALSQEMCCAVSVMDDPVGAQEPALDCACCCCLTQAWNCGCGNTFSTSIICADRPTGSAIVSGLPGELSLAVFPLTESPSLTYLADHCHWDPVTTSRSAGRGSM